MNQGPVSCLPMNSKMSKVKKALDEARDIQARELDLVDKNVLSFDEMPGLCESIIFFDVKNLSRCDLTIFGRFFFFFETYVGAAIVRSRE